MSGSIFRLALLMAAGGCTYPKTTVIHGGGSMTVRMVPLDADGVFFEATRAGATVEQAFPKSHRYVPCEAPRRISGETDGDPWEPGIEFCATDVQVLSEGCFELAQVDLIVDRFAGYTLTVDSLEGNGLLMTWEDRSMNVSSAGSWTREVAWREDCFGRPGPVPHLLEVEWDLPRRYERTERLREERGARMFEL